MTTCDHEYWYYSAVNEDGWRCANCDERPGEPPGFSPELDEKLIETKVHGLLTDLCNAGFVYVSNSDVGLGLVEAVARWCSERGIYDQYSIIHRLVGLKTASHRNYWKKVADGVRSGNDPRERCSCGVLATRFQSVNGVWTGTCKDHRLPMEVAAK